MANLSYFNVIQPMGTWSSSRTYKPQTLPSVSNTTILLVCPQVSYDNVLYVANGFDVDNNPVLPTPGLAPNLDSAWQIVLESSGGGGFQPWEAATNTPTLVNGTDTGFSYINISPGTNIVNFGAGGISFNQNDTVLYDINLGQWYNGGQAAGIQSVTSSTPGLIATSTTNGNVVISAVNVNQTLAASNIFDYTKTDLYLVGAVSLDVSQMILNRMYGVTAIGGSATLTPINGNFVSGGTVMLPSTNSALLKKVSNTQVNIY